jgi:hypothetical protein
MPQPKLIPAIEALAALMVTQAALRFFRFQNVRRGLLALANIGRSATHRSYNREVLIQAVQAARRRCPMRSTCLGEALVAEALLRRCGYSPVLCIGAARRDGRFEAHAWLEQDDAIVVGGPAAVVERYTRFPEIDSLAL